MINNLEPIRTKDDITCGITNIPLSYPARLFFIHPIEDKEKIDMTYDILDTFKIPFERSDNYIAEKCFIKTITNVESKIIRQIFRNFRQLHPKLESDYRYLFWEVDTKDEQVLELVLVVYKLLSLPVYVHESTMGYHFISVKPIVKEKYSWAIRQLRDTNPKYPPITLRIKPNKYVGEENIFFKGSIIYDKKHSDTEQLKKWIETQDFVKIGQYYQIVWYNLNKKQEVIST